MYDIMTIQAQAQTYLRDLLLLAGSEGLTRQKIYVVFNYNLTKSVLDAELERLQRDGLVVMKKRVRHHKDLEYFIHRNYETVARMMARIQNA